MPDTDDVVKNFGTNTWGDRDVEGEDDLAVVQSIGVFDGDENSDRRDKIREFMENL